MYIQRYISFLLRLAIVIVLLTSVFIPQPVLAAPTWTVIAPMNAARFNHTATLLPSGKVLIVGGEEGSGAPLTSVEVYDPSTNTWSPVASLNTAHTEQTATLLASGKVLVAGGCGTNGALTNVEVYDPNANIWTTVAPLYNARFDHTATLLPDGKVLVAGGYNGGSYLTSTEVYDPDTNVWTPVASLHNARSRHTATLLPSGKVLVAGGSTNISGALTSAEVYDPGGNAWTNVASMNIARHDHTATLLPNGQVLVTGGFSNSKNTNGAEVYDPSQGNLGAWTAVASLHNARGSHSATLLPSGKVLVVGGIADNFGTSLASAEVFDPSQGNLGTWTSIALLNDARNYHTATLLANGQVLVAGGMSDSSGFIRFLSSAEVYDDPAVGSWSDAGSLNDARSSHTATLLLNGKVLVAGGIGMGVSSYLNSTEMYDPNTDTWTGVAPLNFARCGHTATLLANGKVLVAGGTTDNPIANAEVYDPNQGALGAWTNVASLNDARLSHTATLLPDGKVLVTGGYNASGILTSTEVYDPNANTWTTVAPLNTAREFHTATLLPNGKLLVAGGLGRSGSLTSAEVYNPTANIWTTVAPMNNARGLHTATLLPGGKVLVTGGADSSVEVYDPSQGALGVWTNVASLNESREDGLSATLLPSGKVLVAGGYDYATSVIASAEIYDPSANTWTLVASMSITHEYHTATLLPSGKVLIVGGLGSENGEQGYGALDTVEVYDPGLGFDEDWRPAVNTVSSSLALGNVLSLTGAGLRGYKFSEAAGSGTNSSATNYPLVQIQRLDNGQWLWVSPGAFSDTSFTSLPVANIPPGPAMVTVFVNGIPSVSKVLVLKYQTVYLPLINR